MRCSAIQRRIISFRTTAGGGAGVGRVGAGRIDLTNANNANVVAFNGSDLDATPIRIKWVSRSA